jgi:hypothetical protein
VADTTNVIVLKYYLVHFAAWLRLAAGFAYDCNKAIGQRSGAAANVVTAAQQIRGLRYRKRKKWHRIGIVGIIGDIRRQRDFNRLVVAEETLKYSAKHRMPIAKEGPQSAGQIRRVPQPPAYVVLMLAHHDHSVADRDDACEIFVQPRRLMWETLFRSGKRSVEPVR